MPTLIEKVRRHARDGDLLATTGRLLLLPFRLFYIWCLASLLGPLGYLRSVHQIVAAWPEGPVRLGAEVALLSHFDQAGAVRPDLLLYIEALRAAGFSVVVVSNSGHLRDDASDQLRRLCAAVLVRRNIGYDFCAWRDALEHLGLPRAETQQVLLINDSVYGPLAPLDELLRRLAASRADVVGLTESRQRGWHLQSYFLGFGPAALRSPVWRDFWSGVRPVPSKQWVISRCELALAARFREAGLWCEALWPTERLLADLHPDSVDGPARAQAERALRAASRRRGVNPTHELWRPLLESGFPFIKRELLRDNPAGVLDVQDWREIAARGGAGGLEMVERDLRRTRAEA